MNCTSSTLTELIIDVETFNDCLYLLDGSFNCLSKLIIYVLEIAYTIETTDNIVSIIVIREKKTVNSIDKYALFPFFVCFDRKNFPN